MYLSLKQRQQLGIEYIPNDKNFIYVPLLHKSIPKTEDIPPILQEKKQRRFPRNYAAGSNIPAVASKMPSEKIQHWKK
jgi:hypothetical protein